MTDNRDRDRLVIEITNLLQGLEKRGLTNEELAEIIFSDIVNPYGEEMRSRYERLVFVTGASYRAQ